MAPEPPFSLHHLPTAPPSPSLLYLLPHVFLPLPDLPQTAPFLSVYPYHRLHHRRPPSASTFPPLTSRWRGDHRRWGRPSRAPASPCTRSRGGGAPGRCTPSSPERNPSSLSSSSTADPLHVCPIHHHREPRGELLTPSDILSLANPLWSHRSFRRARCVRRRRCRLLAAAPRRRLNQPPSAPLSPSLPIPHWIHTSARAPRVTGSSPRAALCRCRAWIYPRVFRKINRALWYLYKKPPF